MTVSTPPVLLLVEGPTDEAVVVTLLHRAGVNIENLRIVAVGGVDRFKDTLLALTPGDAAAVAILVDADGPSTGKTVAEAHSRSGLTVHAFVAVPNIEAWLSPDDATARHLADLVNRTDRIASATSGRSRTNVLEEIASALDVAQAAARAPSLRGFLLGMSNLLGVPTPDLVEGAGRSLPSDVLAGLLREVSPETIVWRTSGGNSFTSRELISEVERRTVLGREYASDLLRVARDLIVRKAGRSA